MKPFGIRWKRQASSTESTVGYVGGSEPGMKGWMCNGLKKRVVLWAWTVKLNYVSTFFVCMLWMPTFSMFLLITCCCATDLEFKPRPWKNVLELVTKECNCVVQVSMRSWTGCGWLWSRKFILIIWNVLELVI